MLPQAHPSNLLTDPLRERTIEKQKVHASYLAGGVDQFAMGLGMKCEQIDATKRKIPYYRARQWNISFYSMYIFYS